MKPQLSLRDGLLALAVVFVWGTNFVVIRLGLDVLPPLFFATLRFFFVLFPACLLLPKPQVSWANLAFYGVAAKGSRVMCHHFVAEIIAHDLKTDFVTADREIGYGEF